jgi:hypothetical protein
MSFSQSLSSSYDIPQNTNLTAAITTANISLNQIEVIIESDNPAVPRVARSWDLPASNLLPQFEQWIEKLTPLLQLSTVPFNGAITAKAPWGEQEVKLTDATAENILTWGTMMIDV